MKEHVERMMKEHSELVVRISKLDNFLYGNNGLNIHTDIENNKTQDDLFRNMTEFANKCMQLADMKHYATCLECRLNNEGVYFENGEYLEKVAEIVNLPESKENTDNGEPNE